MALATPVDFVPFSVAVASLIFLALLGVVGAKIGGAKMLKAAVRVTSWGAFAMAVTAGIGWIFGMRV
jgi:VIT1/CCC1 family predicted Fe2+/Mn2+ transporter